MMIAFWSGHVVSENRRLAPGRGRWHLSKEYRAFKLSLVSAFTPGAERFEGPVSVRLIMQLRNKRRDAQNLIKPVLDALQEAGVYADDRQVRHLTLTREDAPSIAMEDWMSITVWQDNAVVDREGT